jgi:prephenate dehydrogenase
MRIAILGVGLIGGSIGLAARQRLDAEVVGFDPDPATLERAREEGAIDRGATAVADACDGAEVVFCAAPVAGGLRPGDGRHRRRLDQARHRRRARR